MELNALSQDGSTGLILASSEGHLEVVKALLDAGADKEARDQVGVAGNRRNPTVSGVKIGHRQWLDVLLIMWM